MDTIKKLTLMFAAATLFFSCSSDSDGGSSGDPIIGKWATISEKENGIDEVLTECDLTEVQEFLADGTALLQDNDLENGVCVSNNPPAEANLVVTWSKLSSNSYLVEFTVNGTLVNQSTLTTVFSNSDNTLTVTSTDSDGDVNETVMHRIP